MINSENVKSFEIVKSSNSVVSSTVMNNFFAFLDVAPLTIRSYTSGIKQFISFLREHGVKNPTRENVLAFKKDLIAKGKKSRLSACICQPYADFLIGRRQRRFTLMLQRA